MRCWACPKPIKLADLVSQLPIVGAIVHIACYVRETGHQPIEVMTVREALRRLYGLKPQEPGRRRARSAA